MISSSVAGIVFANSYDEAFGKLTQKRSIASIPFGGRYRLIDFCLSNLVNAGVSDVGVITKEKYRSLMDHIGSGVHWDLDRKNGGIMILPPFNRGASRVYQGFIEALYSSMDFMIRCNTKYMIVCDARTVANVDIAAVVRQHKETNADVTVVCNRGLKVTNKEQAMKLDINKDGKITGMHLSYDENADDIRSMNIYVFDREKLIESVKTSYENGGITVASDLVSANLDKLNVMAYEHKGYAAIMDCITAYRRANFELLDSDIRADLFNTDRPIYTKTRDDMPTRYGTHSLVKNSLIAEGCIIEGSVKNSVLFRGVKVEKGATVENCILMQDVCVNENVVLQNVISDKNAEISNDMIIKGTDEKAFLIEKDQKI